jgi:hypothetical protein
MRVRLAANFATGPGSIADETCTGDIADGCKYVCTGAGTSAFPLEIQALPGCAATSAMALVNGMRPRLVTVGEFDKSRSAPYVSRRNQGPRNLSRRLPFPLRRSRSRSAATAARLPLLHQHGCLLPCSCRIEYIYFDAGRHDL